MKDFEDMTLEEREEILEQIKNLPVESNDPLDLFTNSFNELSQNWSNALKEFDTIYSDCNNNGSQLNPNKEKDKNGWRMRVGRDIY